MSKNFIGKSVGIWNKEFKQGYDDFLWDRGCNSNNFEYLKGYEYAQAERVSCRKTGSGKPRKPRCKLPKGVILERVIAELNKGLSYVEVSKIVGCSENYAYKISKGRFE